MREDRRMMDDGWWTSSSSESEYDRTLIELDFGLRFVIIKITLGRIYRTSFYLLYSYESITSPSKQGTNNDCNKEHQCELSIAGKSARDIHQHNHKCESKRKRKQRNRIIARLLLHTLQLPIRLPNHVLQHRKQIPQPAPRYAHWPPQHSHHS